MAEPTNGASRVGLWLSIAISGSVLLGMVGAMFYVAFNTKANSETLETQKAINDKLASEIRSLQLQHNSMEVGLNEIETQFCAQDIVRNLMHASEMRTTSLLWEKQFGTRMPTDNAYYPTICNRRTK
jgi:hypothetical protein